MSKFFFSNEEIKEMREQFKLPDISVIPGNRELEEEYDNLRYYKEIETRYILIDGTIQNHFLDLRIKKAAYALFTQPDISVTQGNRELEEEYDNLRYYRAIETSQISNDGTVQKQIVAHNLPSEYDVKKANQSGCINLITGCFNDLLKQKGERGRFKKIDASFKERVDFDYFNELNKKKLFEILILKPSRKYSKNSDEFYNLKLYEKIKNKPIFKNLLEENYLEFFRNIYYKSEKRINLKKYTDDRRDEILILSDNIKTYKDKVEKFTDPEKRECYENITKKLYINKFIMEN
jgi:hypothetical protein